MIDAIKQDCPLCGAEAEYRPKDFGRAKYFSCSAGCKYFIFDSTEKLLKSVPQSWIDDLSKKARLRQDGKIFVIRRPTPPQDKILITGEFLPSEEWLR